MTLHETFKQLDYINDLNIDLNLFYVITIEPNIIKLQGMFSNSIIKNIHEINNDNYTLNFNTSTNGFIYIELVHNETNLMLKFILT